MATDPNAAGGDNGVASSENIDYKNLSKTKTLKFINDGTIIAFKKDKKQFPSKTWDTFYALKLRNGVELEKWVQCQRCKGLYAGSSSTGSLNQHPNTK